MVCGLWLTRRYFFLKPPVPPAAASVEVQKRYWQTRLRTDVSDKDAFLNLGILEERSGFYTSARRHLEAARALGVDDRDICGPLGRLLIQLAEPEKAQVELEKAVALFPGKWEPIANLAGFYASDNLSSKADAVLLKFWNSVDKTTLKSQDTQRLALAFLECGDMKHAVESAKFLVESDPGNTGGQILAARCAYAAKDLKSARTYAEAALKETPNESAALYFYGLILHALKDYDGALSVWQKANAANPSAGDVYERIGEEYARRGDFKRASLALEKIAIADPGLASAAKTAEAYRRAGATDDADYWEAVAAGFARNYPQALQLAQKAAASTDARKRRRGLSAVAEAYLGLGKKKEYLATILKTTEAGTAEDYLLRAHAYEILDQYELRLTCLDRAIQKDPTQEAAIRFDRSGIFEKIGSRDEAEKELERAVTLQPENAQFVQSLADIYLKRSSVGDRLSKATALAERAASLAPDNHEAWMTLGQCYASANRLGEAARCIEHAIDLEAGNGPAYLELSRVYARLGNVEASQGVMKQYQKYVVFEQKRQTLRTRAQRKTATSAEIVEYADLLLNMRDFSGALSQYENAYALNPKDKAVRKTLQTLYRRLNLTAKLAALDAAP